MFCDDYKERKQSCVAIHGVSPDVMKILIRYAYTSSLEVKNEDVQRVLEASSVLQVSGPFSFYCMFLHSNFFLDLCNFTVSFTEKESLQVNYDHQLDC